MSSEQEAVLTAKALAKALRDQDSSWHFDRRIPISLILALFTQTAALAWWAASVESRIGVMETGAVSEEWVTQTTMRVDTLETGLKELQEVSIKTQISNAISDYIAAQQLQKAAEKLTKAD